MYKVLIFISLALSAFVLFWFSNANLSTSNLNLGSTFGPCKQKCMQDYVECGEKNCNYGDGFAISDCYHACNRTYDKCTDLCSE